MIHKRELTKIFHFYLPRLSLTKVVYANPLNYGILFWYWMDINQPSTELTRTFALDAINTCQFFNDHLKTEISLMEHLFKDKLC